MTATDNYTFQPGTTVAFVTGANKPSGIGRATVAALLAAGVPKVYATAREPQQLQDLVASSAGRVTAVKLDVTDPDSIRAAVAQAPDVTLLVNNSGYFGGVDSLPLTGAILTGYAETPASLLVPPDEGSLRTWVARALLARATEPFRAGEPDWLEGIHRRLDQVEAVLR